MIDITIKSEVSILLDVNGVELYVGDNETPTEKISLDSLVIEFLESRCIGSECYDIDDIKEVRDAFQRGLDTLNAAIKNSE